MKSDIYIIKGINPQPWEAGKPSILRRGGKMVPIINKSHKVKHYQESVRSAFKKAYPDAKCLPKGTPFMLNLVFWREIETWETPTAKGRKGTSNYVDATNVQKTTEDALQGLLYKNDTDNLWVSSAMVDQRKGVEPAILIELIVPSEDEIEDWRKERYRLLQDEWIEQFGDEEEEPEDVLRDIGDDPF